MYNTAYIQMNKYFDTRNGDFIACKCCNAFIINAEVIQFYKMAEEFREWYNRSMPVNSGFRCVKHNTEEKGEKNSLHLQGIALDIGFTSDFYDYPLARKKEFLNNVKMKWFELCHKYKVAGGFGSYNGWFHIDSRPTNRATWNKSNYF